MMRRAAGSMSVFALAMSAPLAAQADYYNTGTGRPLRIEDAQAVEFKADWLSMAIAMGVAEQGGAAVGHMEMAPRAAAPAASGHAGHGARVDSTTRRDSMAVSPDGADTMVRLLMEMLQDSVIRARIVADSALRRATEQAIRALPPEHRDQLLEMLGERPTPRSLQSSGNTPRPTARSVTP